MICSRPKYNLPTHQFLGQYLNPVQSYGPRSGFVYSLRSVAHLELDVDQNLIISSPYIRDFLCKRKLIYVHRFSRYFGNRQTNRPTNRQTDRQTDRRRRKHYLLPEGRRAIIIQYLNINILIGCRNTDIFVLWQ